MDRQTSDAAAPASAATGIVEIPPEIPVLQPVVQSRNVVRLLVLPAAFSLLQKAPIIVQHARNRGVVRRLDSIYYDTGERSLFGSFLSLRVQRQGRRFIQTLRQYEARQPGPAGYSVGQTSRSFQSSRMWQTPVDSAMPDLSRLAGIEAPATVAPLIEQLSGTPLMAVFETRMRRRLRRLELPGALVDVAFDDGVIEADTRAEALSEISLSLHSGDAGVLYDIGMRLLELAPLRIGTVSVARRGYALASGKAIKAERATPSALTPAFAVDDMVASVFSACRSHLQANQGVAEAGVSADGVHQMRVALRRMRSAFSLLRRELPSATMLSLGEEAKWVADQLGVARSWDVFLGTTLTGPEHWRTNGTDFAGLRQAAERPRDGGYETVRDMLGAARYGRFQLTLGQWIERRGWRNEVDRDGLGVLAEPASSMAARVLTRLCRKTFRQGAHFKRLSATERHELRITLKKLRYATEFFLPLFAAPGPGSRSASAERYVRRLSRLQDALGLDHDAATTQPLLDEIGQASQSPGVHQAIGAVIGWQARECLVAGETLAKHWQRFKALPPFWTRPVLP